MYAIRSYYASPAEEEIVFEVEAYDPVTVLGILVAFRDAGEGARP